MGATCVSVDTHGKNLFIHFDNGLSLRGHLRMFGKWHVYRPGEPWRLGEWQARLVLETAESVVVNFSSPVVELLETRAIPHYRPVAKLGQDLLAADFDVAEAVARFRDAALAGQFIGEAIMDQRVIAGVGNIWKHETLFRAGINPWRRVRELGDDELATIVTIARSLLRESAGVGASTGRRPRMLVYMRAGQPCVRCHSILRGAPQGEDIRHTTWCSVCQPVVAGQSLPPRRRTDARPSPGG